MNKTTLLDDWNRAGADDRAAIGFIIDDEARLDRKGRLAVYTLPKGDGGGAYEVAGINSRFHPAAARELRALIVAGADEEARNLVAAYLFDYTGRALSVRAFGDGCPALRYAVRDAAFNRGPRGSARILQEAINNAIEWLGLKTKPLKRDGVVGDKTLGALYGVLEVAGEGFLLAALRVARESYERRVAPPRGARAKFWRGLVNRWNKVTHRAAVWE